MWMEMHHSHNEYPNMKMFLPLSITTSITVTVMINFTALLNDVAEVAEIIRPNTTVFTDYAAMLYIRCL